MKRDARLSPCGNYRWVLTRSWGEGPELLIVMFNPSSADASKDDPTVTLLCQIARRNLFGSLAVVNAIPLRSSKPADAIAMTQWDRFPEDWHARDRLQDNVGVIVDRVSRAGAVLLAWGALAARCSDWIDHVREEIDAALPTGSEIYCLGQTASGHPKHPMARGRHKVPKDASLIPWTRW